MIVRLIAGRFQPFHNGHLSYATEAADGCDLLVVGLTRALSGHSPDIASIPNHRLAEDDNPLSVAERALIALSALHADARITADVTATLVPIENPQWLRSVVPQSWEIALTLHERWNETKRAVFEEAGYNVKVVCQDSPKTYHGSELRRMLRVGDARWREQMPAGAVVAMDELGIPQRLRCE